MKRKLVTVITVVTISMGLLACGSKSTASPDTAEVMEEEPTPEESTSEEEAPVEEEKPEVSEEPDEEAETESEEVPEQEEDAPIWYMDEEGLKSEELGIKIKRDSAEWEKFGFSGSFMIPLTDNSIQNFDFTCYYYGGDLDSYISEHTGTERTVLDDVVYALKEPNEHDTIREVTFVENGIALSITLWDYDIKDIMKEEGLSVYEADGMDYLAYVKDGILYCPAVGIKFSGIEDTLFGSVLRTYCSVNGGYVQIVIDDEDFSFLGSNAEERLEQFIKDREDVGFLGIDEVVERDLGKYSFMGRGFSDEYGDEHWTFLSDETTCSISIYCTGEDKFENYFSLIEELQ